MRCVDGPQPVEAGIARCTERRCRLGRQRARHGVMQPHPRPWAPGHACLNGFKGSTAPTKPAKPHATPSPPLTALCRPWTSAATSNLLARNPSNWLQLQSSGHWAGGAKPGPAPLLAARLLGWRSAPGLWVSTALGPYRGAAAAAAAVPLPPPTPPASALFPFSTAFYTATIGATASGVHLLARTR